MDKNTLRINMTERERLRQQYLEGVPNDVYDTLWALEVMQERVSYWEYASRIATEFVQAMAGQEFLGGRDKEAAALRKLAVELKQYMDRYEHKPKYETYAMEDAE